MGGGCLPISCQLAGATATLAPILPTVCMSRLVSFCVACVIKKIKREHTHRLESEGGMCRLCALCRLHMACTRTWDTHTHTPNGQRVTLLVPCARVLAYILDRAIAVPDWIRSIQRIPSERRRCQSHTICGTLPAILYYMLTGVLLPSCKRTRASCRRLPDCLGGWYECRMVPAAAHNATCSGAHS